MQSKTKRAVIYCRVASKDHDDFAIETQRSSLIRFAESRGFEVCAEYLDNGVSGLTLDRPAFNRLREDMIAGYVKTVFVKSVSRISRNIHQVFQWFDKAKELGVEVVSEWGDLPEDSDPLRTFFNNMLIQK